MDAKTIRQTFLDFFRRHQHKIVASAPIVNKDDPSLMFTNAGMNQFKDLLTATEPPADPRVADTQKCLRVSGKHNDLEEVGYDTYHHTMFEMLGNWSFGDYFKEGAIDLAWRLLTAEYGISADRLYATVFEGDTNDGLPADEEAADLWQKYLPKERILYFDKADNFWEMGDTGPCGPCSEIHIDLRSEAERRQTPGAELINTGHFEVIELWNLVFIQFDRKKDGSLSKLPLQSVDTGLGFERLVMVLQDLRSSYDTDVFQPLMQHLSDHYGCRYGREEMESIAMRVAADHIRAAAFAIADGQLPSNTGAGYVIRRIIRRASRFGFQYLNIRQAFLFKMVEVLDQQFQAVFPELHEQKAFVQQVIQQEEQSFLQTLERGTKRFFNYLAEHPDAKTIDGGFAFELYDTYGFPVDLTQVMAREQGYSVDMEGFQAHMAAQRQRSKQAQQVDAGDWVRLQPEQPTAFLGYDYSELSAQMIKYRQVADKKSTYAHIVLDRTPFYAEAGGQVGDTGFLTKGEETLRVWDTKTENDQIIHVCDRLPEAPAGRWHAQIDVERREQIKLNHTATHLLHEALRRVVGEHVEQRGSLVAPDYLRFDFSHFSKLSDEELQEVERRVNDKIAAAIPREEIRDVPIDEAKAMGATALFGEKYGERVRVIRFGADYSTELCGGTHAPNTQDIRYFHIRSEAAVASGIRRIEAVTGERALNQLEQQAGLLNEIKTLLKNPKDIRGAIEQLQEQNKTLKKQLEAARGAALKQIRAELLANARQAKGYQYITQRVAVESGEELKQLAFDLRNNAGTSTIAVLGTILKGKPQLNVVLTDDLADNEQLQANALIKPIAQQIQGGGGGQAIYASAGGKNPEGLDQALQEAERRIRATVEATEA